MGVEHRGGAAGRECRVVVLGAPEWTDEDVVEAALGVLWVGLGPLAVLHAGRPGAEQLAGRAARRFGFPVLDLPPDPESVMAHVARRRTRELVAAHDPDRALLFEGPGWSAREVRDHLDALVRRGQRPVGALRVPWDGSLEMVADAVRTRDAYGEKARPVPVRGPLDEEHLAEALRTRDPRWIVALVDECRRLGRKGE